MVNVFSLFQVLGNWSDWDNWSVCSATCDMGMRSQLRSCNNPRPGVGGHDCAGTNMEYSLCTSTSCAGMFERTCFDQSTSKTNTQLVGQIHQYISCIAEKFYVPFFFF